MPRRFTGSNILDSVSGQDVPLVSPTPPPPTVPPTTPTPIPTSTPSPPLSVGGARRELGLGPGLLNLPFGLGGGVAPPSSTSGGGIAATGNTIGDIREVELPSGRVVQQVYAPPLDQFGFTVPGAEPIWTSVESYFGRNAGGAASDAGYLAETVRSNLAREAEQRRQRALDAASNAANAYLTGTQLSDARRLNAFQESRALLPFLVDPSQEFFSGLEPGGLVQSGLERIGAGRGFQPTRIQHKQLAPASLGLPPTGEQVGSEIVESIGDIRGAGAA